MATTEPQAQVTEARHQALGLGPDDLLEMYYFMALARAIDERMWVLQRAGIVPFVISGQGHEGAQVGVMWATDRARDWLVPFYRSLAACLVKGMTPRELMLGLFARADDPSSGGRQMPAHWGHPARKILSTSSPVGTQYLHAVGIAFATKVRGTGEVCVTSIGEGGTSQGDWHEAMNFAGIHRLPVVFMVENNRYAISVPQRLQMAVPDVAVRAAGYGFPGVVVDGSDVLACHAAGREAVARARGGEGPTLIECKVERLTSHSSDDSQEKYRPTADLEAARSKDPLVVFKHYLEQVGVMDEARYTAIHSRIKAEVNDATDYAEARPMPDPATVTRHVYHEGDGHA
ncbi:MAG: thiamine pyrophosphate-dependent dehydrogenase E1 component subunit alpha [Armatimonadota bacterium]|nr:thiamine pyrophosphate-dependent dehydrogenase E1 component subunit alpha [Armatimonadota bacterium]MDR7549806.1 thiamine pyrophosphate-dependent dehydrogenase E1 component subunit alpha [Armatimonadota bacterium]